MKKRQIKRKKTLSAARKLVVGTFGSIILLIGIISMFLPTPAFLLIPLGIAILASEFIVVGIYVKRYNRKLKEKYCTGKKRHKNKKLCDSLEDISGRVDRKIEKKDST